MNKYSIKRSNSANNFECRNYQCNHCVDSPSINECLEKGANLVPLLFDTIIKFESYPVRIVSDFEKAFYQVQISPSDRCML